MVAHDGAPARRGRAVWLSELPPDRGGDRRVEARVGDLQVVAEDPVVAALETQAGPLALGPLEPGDPAAAVASGGAETVELLGVAGAEDAAIPDRGRRI